MTKRKYGRAQVLTNCYNLFKLLCSAEGTYKSGWFGMKALRLKRRNELWLDF